MPRISAYRLQSVGLRYSQEPGARIPFPEILEMAGAPSDIVNSPDATVELLHEAGAVETVCRVLEDKTFAARVGLSAQGPGTLLAYIVRAAETVEDALALTQRFYAMQDPDLHLDVVGAPDEPKITLESSVIPAHQYPRHREMLVFGLYKRVQQITSGGFAPISIELETDDVEHCKLLAELAGCAVEGFKSGYALALPPNGMSFRIPTADPTLLGHLRRHGEEQLKAQPDAVRSLSDRIVDMLGERLPGPIPNGDQIAGELGLTRRTMTRHLSAEGTSFKALLEGVLCDLSKRMLRSGEGVARVAFMLGFADQAAFSVAFKRWTGETPARFRKAGR
ncbi:helix-turn-helix domain-containing protein [Ruegeria atlantica]|uniref:helix-turn-helix domain-containing protein n=1 Tax=Ruegeria atlantica TaxID=81569 RepID=UPI0024946F79|nr:AraC family transcriptional regulator [Ruegeria atlantica]